MKRDSAKPLHACFAVCAPGLEALVSGELRALGLRPGKTDRGGVEFAATTRQLYAANVFLRTATRILLRIASFEAASFAALEREARRVPWDQWLAPDAPVAFSVSSAKSRLYHTDAVAERLAAVLPGSDLPAFGRIRKPQMNTDEHGWGMGSGAEAPPSAFSAALRETPPSQLFARLVHDHCVLSIDTSGEPLHRRGWRLETAKAPLRETLAAAMILSTGWDGSTPLLDPLCGSGTIAIEAALIARGVAPGSAREFAFKRWPCFEPGTFASVAGQARAAAQPARPLVVVASDRDPGAIRAAQANAERAGVADAIDFRCRELEDLERPPRDPSGPPSRTGWVISNPPYGHRVTGELRGLYVTLGDVVRRLLPGWRVGLLVADDRLAAGTDLRLRPAFSTSNGGIRVRFLASSV